MRIRPFQAIYPRVDLITSADSFFGTVKYDYNEYIDSGFFTKTAQDGIYIYQIQTARRNFTGLIACADIHDYYDGKIKKHENTLAAKEQSQLTLMLKRNAIVKPVLLTYKQKPSIAEWIKNFIKKETIFFRG